jgi:hypothetical protein
VPVTDFDRAHIGEILKDRHGSRYDWFTCYLLRLIVKADRENRERIRSAFPDEVEAFEHWLYKSG